MCIVDCGLLSSPCLFTSKTVKLVRKHINKLNGFPWPVMLSSKAQRELEEEREEKACFSALISGIRKRSTANFLTCKFYFLLLIFLVFAFVDIRFKGCVVCLVS
ncbi:hypothetical protein V2J09_012287 [Rumex salicifolius]